MVAVRHLGFAVRMCGITHDVFLMVFITIHKIRF